VYGERSKRGRRQKKKAISAVSSISKQNEGGKKTKDSPKKMKNRKMRRKGKTKGIENARHLTYKKGNQLVQQMRGWNNKKNGSSYKNAQ